jgi:hypothetical protein
VLQGVTAVAVLKEAHQIVANLKLDGIKSYEDLPFSPPELLDKCGAIGGNQFHAWYAALDRPTVQRIVACHPHLWTEEIFATMRDSGLWPVEAAYLLGRKVVELYEATNKQGDLVSGVGKFVAVLVCVGDAAGCDGLRELATCPDSGFDLSMHDMLPMAKDVKQQTSDTDLEGVKRGTASVVGGACGFSNRSEAWRWGELAVRLLKTGGVFIATDLVGGTGHAVLSGALLTALLALQDQGFLKDVNVTEIEEPRRSVKSTRSRLRGGGKGSELGKVKVVVVTATRTDKDHSELDTFAREALVQQHSSRRIDLGKAGGVLEIEFATQTCRIKDAPSGSDVGVYLITAPRECQYPAKGYVGSTGDMPTRFQEHQGGQATKGSNHVLRIAHAAKCDPEDLEMLPLITLDDLPRDMVQGLLATSGDGTAHNPWRTSIEKVLCLIRDLEAHVIRTFQPQLLYNAHWPVVHGNGYAAAPELAGR